MGYRMRPMRWWDVEQVAAVEAEVFAESRWRAEQFWSELAQPTRRYLVVEEVDQGMILAYGGIFILGADSDVQTIAVTPRAQRRGIGRTLMEHLMDCAREEEARSMMLEVRSDNLPAIDLYQRLGFEQISIRRDYYAPGVDARIMQRRPL